VQKIAMCAGGEIDRRQSTEAYTEAFS